MSTVTIRFYNSELEAAHLTFSDEGNHIALTYSGGNDDVLEERLRDALEDRCATLTTRDRLVDRFIEIYNEDMILAQLTKCVEER